MKKFLLIFIVIALVSHSALAAQKRSKPNPPYALARGFANVLTCWLELPRGLIYENARIPIIGFFTGTLKGGFLTMYRAVAGTIDIAAMGLTREGLYFNDFPDFIWDADWISPCGEDMIESKNLDCNPCLNCKEIKWRGKPYPYPKQKPPHFYRKKFQKPVPPPPLPPQQPVRRRYRRPVTPPSSEDWGAKNDNPQPFGLYVSAEDDAKQEAKILQMEQQINDIERRAAMYQ